MREMWSRPWLMSSVVLLFLGLYAPLRADDATDAAQAAAEAADAAAAAAASAAAAAKSSSDTASTVESGNDAGAMPNASKADQAANAANDAAIAAANLAQQALQDAKNAQADQKNDPNKAKSDADKAKDAANKAKDQAKKAAAQAAAAADQVDKAKQQQKNDKNNGQTTPLSDDEVEDLDNYKRDANDSKKRNDTRKQEAKNLRKEANDLFKAEMQDDKDTQLKGAQKHPGDGSLQWYPHVGFFVADVAPNQKSLLFPNLNSPLAVPELTLSQNQSALLQLELINNNPFPVDATRVSGSLFGDAVSFTPFVGDQTVPANGSALIGLGTVQFTGTAGAFTAADFNIATDAAHPALGPDFETNFAVATPEPASITLLILGVIGMAVYCWRQRKGSGYAKRRYNRKLWLSRMKKAAYPGLNAPALRAEVAPESSEGVRVALRRD